MRSLFILSLRQMLGGKKIWILGAFLCLPILLLAVTGLYLGLWQRTGIRDLAWVLALIYLWAGAALAPAGTLGWGGRALLLTDLNPLGDPSGSSLLAALPAALLTIAALRVVLLPGVPSRR